MEMFLKSVEMGGENPKMGGEKSRDNIIRQIRRNPNITMSELAASIGISAKAVEKQIARMKKDGILVRIGPDRINGAKRKRVRRNAGLAMSFSFNFRPSIGDDEC